MSTPTPGPWILATSNSWRRIVSTHGVTVCEPIKQPDGHPDLYFPNGGVDGDTPLPPLGRMAIAKPVRLRPVYVMRQEPNIGD